MPLFPWTRQGNAARIACEELVQERLSAPIKTSPEVLLALPEFRVEFVQVGNRRFRVDVEHRRIRSGEHWILVAAGKATWHGFVTMLAERGIALESSGVRDLGKDEVECFGEVVLWGQTPSSSQCSLRLPPADLQNSRAIVWMHERRGATAIESGGLEIRTAHSRTLKQRSQQQASLLEDSKSPSGLRSLGLFASLDAAGQLGT